jgi:hypothetical protein
MNLLMGLLGALSFAFGATIVVFFCLLTLTSGLPMSGIYLPLTPFVGFLFVGLGLWLIVDIGKWETKQNPS